MKKTGFEIEKIRQRLAKKNDLNRLIKLYSSRYPEIKDLNRPEFWDQIYKDESYLNTQDGMTKDRIRTAVGFIPKGKIKLLDVGVGMGFVEELINRDKNKEIYANDFSKVSVDYLKKKYKGHFSLQSIYNLKYPKNFFDVALVLEVLEHVPPSKTFKVLSSISKLLKPNGIMIASVPMNEGLEKMNDNPSGHVRMYTEDLIWAELSIAGFESLEYKTFFAFPYLYNIRSALAKTTKRKHPNNIVLKAKKI